YTNFGWQLDMFRHKSEVLAGHCRDLGTDFDAITRSVNFNVVIGESQQEVDDRLGRVVDLYHSKVSAERAEAGLRAYRQSPAVGTVEQVIESLTGFQKAGMSYAICYFPDAAHDKSMIKLF